MIKEVYLFTNRNLLAFDEHGEQIIDVQRAITWNSNSEWSGREKETEVLKKIIQDKPAIYLANWIEQWKHEITIDEFCSLLGHGPWYWEKYKKPSEDQESQGEV